MKSQYIRPYHKHSSKNIKAFGAFDVLGAFFARLRSFMRFCTRNITPFTPLIFLAKKSQKKRTLAYVLFLSLFVLIPIALHAKETLNTTSLIDTLKSSEITDAKIISTQESGINGFWFVIVQKDNFQIPFFASSDGKTLMILSQEALITKNTTLKNTLESTTKKVQEFNEKAREEAVIEVFQRYPESVLKLEGKAKGNSKKSITYLVLDTNCPYCKQELQKIDNYLASGDLHILIAGALSLESTKKAATFYTKLGEQKTQESKISYLKKAFEPSYKPSNNINADKAMNIAQELGGAGLQGVPYIIKR